MPDSPVAGRHLIGRAVSEPTDWSPVEEVEQWVGKPWRRLSLLRMRHFYKGEVVGRDADLTLHFGWRRFGLSFTLILGKHDVLDYSEEPNQ